MDFDERLADTLMLIFQYKTTFQDHRAIAREADNINRKDVGDWIRQNPDKFHEWFIFNTGIYSMPDIEDWWE